MKVQDVFMNSESIEELVAAYLQFNDSQFPRLRGLTNEVLELDDVILAPAALLAELLNMQYLGKQEKELKVLVVGSDVYATSYEGANFNYATLMSAFKRVSYSFVSHRYASPVLNDDTKVRFPVQNLSFEEAVRCEWDFVLWARPNMVDGESDELLDFVKLMVERGVTVYGAHTSKLDAITQSYGVADKGLVFNWVDSPITGRLTERSRSQFARPGVDEEEWRWGSVITKLQKASHSIPDGAWALIRAAMKIHWHICILNVRSVLNKRMEIERHGEQELLGLIGNMSISPSSGIIVRHDKYGPQNAGSVPLTMIAELPKTEYELLPIAAKILLSNLNGGKYWSDKDNIIIEDMLYSAYSQGVVEAGIAIAYSRLENCSEPAVEEAYEIFSNVGIRHYKSCYELGNNLINNIDEDVDLIEEGFSLIIESSRQGYLPAMNEHGKLLMNEGDVEGALSLWHEGRKQFCPDALYSLGIFHYKRGNRLEALQYLFNSANLGHMWAHNSALKAADAASVANELHDAAAAIATKYTLKILTKDYWLSVG